MKVRFRFQPSRGRDSGRKQNLPYDANGNMTNNNGVTYTWDAENQLVSTSSGLGFEYDYTGRRVKKITPAGTMIYPFTDYEIDPVGDRKTYLSVEAEIVGVTMIEFRGLMTLAAPILRRIRNS